jgi:predicted alpha/beta-fold hydrolase
MESFSFVVLGVFALQRWKSLLEGSYVHTEVYGSKSAVGQSSLKKVNDMLVKMDYIPPLYCILEQYGQLQTFMQFTVRNITRVLKNALFKQYSILYDREILVMPDSGTIALDWAKKAVVSSDDPLLRDSSPVIILHHGLVGDSQSEYIYHLCDRLLSAGYRVVVKVARGCGDLQLTSGEMFAGRRTEDISLCIDRVHARFPKAKIFLVAFSLGAALTLQYLSYDHDHSPQVVTSAADGSQSVTTYRDRSSSNDATCPLTAAMCVSPPWNICLNSFQPTIINALWSMMLVVPLKVHLLTHISFLRHLAPAAFSHITTWNVLACRNMAQFDELVYATHFRADGGRYPTLQSYYEDISPAPRAHLIRTPTLVLSSKDDPLCNHTHAPTDPSAIGPGLVVVCAKAKYLYLVSL